MRKNKYIFIPTIEKFLLQTIAVFILTTLCSHHVLSQPVLRYHLEIDEQTWDAFQVNISINNNKIEKLLCYMPEIYPWLALNHRTGNNISKFEVLDRFGNKIQFSQVNASTWIINAMNNDIVNISYRVSNRNDHILGERLNRKFARIDCGSVLLFIRELKNSPLYLTVRVPHRWKLATGLGSKDQIFEYFVENYEQLVKHPLYMAAFEEIYFRLKDRTGYIIIDGRQTPEVGKLSSIAAKIAYYQTKLFDDIPFDRYLFIFKLFPGARQFVSKAYQNTSIYYLTHDLVKENLFDIAKEISSNFFQMWNGYRFYPVSMKWDEILQNPCTCNLWFCYGLSDYYGTLSLVRAGCWSEQDFINYSLKTVNRYLRHEEGEMPSLATLSSHISNYDYKKAISFIRLKGHLVALLLDLKIRELTNNRKSLDDVIFFMNKWYGDQDIGYHEGDILRAISAVTGANLTTFFDLYINGTVELPIVPAFQTAGILFESKPDTLPDLGEFQISMDENIITQIDKFSPLETAGMKVGDKLISLNDIPIFYPQQIEQIVDTLLVGQELDISIQREGLSLMLIARVAGKACEALSLGSIEPQTEQQQLIRKSWLVKQLP